MSVSPEAFVFTQTTSDGSVGRMKAPMRLVARAASTANVADLTACSTSMDGVTLVAGNVVLLKNQSTASQNGYYIVGVVTGSNTAPLTRAWPFASGDVMTNGTQFFVEEGTVNAATTWTVTNSGTVTVDTTSLAFSQAAGSKTLPIMFSLYDFREVTSGGDVGNIAANGGLLASDTTPILRGDAAEVQEIAWAAGNADIICLQKSLPNDIDGTVDITVELWVYTDNTGGGGIEAASFIVETSWNGGAIVSDTATDSTPATTSHKITATIAAADIPDTPSFLTLMLTPDTHANDPTQLQAIRLLYKSL